MSDLYTEVLVKKQQTGKDKAIKGVLIFFTVLFAAAGIMMNPLILLLALVLGIVDYIFIPKLSVEFEYLYVNGELDGLDRAIGDMFDSLKVGGRLAIITFHSLEDRAVKQTFASLCEGCICPPEFPVCVCGRKSMGKVITRKPILPSKEELEENSRSKSAKLRVFERAGKEE